MRDLGNLVLRVDAEKTYALRLCTPDMSRQRLDTEANWLAALRRDMDLLVPEPVVNIRGNLVSEVEGRLCVLFEWLEGSPKSPNPKVREQRM
jgi:Ser/Thr protein kinase RdoA (MazF antagonist)